MIGFGSFPGYSKGHLALRLLSWVNLHVPPLSDAPGITKTPGRNCWPRAVLSIHQGRSPGSEARRPWAPAPAVPSLAMLVWAYYSLFTLSDTHSPHV